VGFVDPHATRVSAVRQPAAGASAPGHRFTSQKLSGQIDMCIVRENIANPIAQIWSGAMMFEHLGQPKAARGVEKAFEAVLARPDAQTPDLGGKASTGDVGDAVPQEISAVAET
jgi:isocitrate dehydrogenase